MTIHRREGEGGRGVNSAGMKKMKTGSYTILNYKVDEPGKGGKIHFFTTASRSDDGGGREGGQKSNINLFLSKHQQIKGINGVSEGGRAGGKGVAKLGFFDQKDNRAPHHFCKKYLYEGIDLET